MKNTVWFLIALVLFSSGFLYGSTSELHWQDLVAKAVNSLILFGGLFYLLRKPLREYLGRRSRQVEKGIRDQQKNRKEAQQRLDKLDKQQKSLSRQMEQQKEENRKRMEDQVRKINEHRDREIKDIQSQIDEEIREKKEIMLTRMKGEIADAIIRRFREDLGKKPDPGLQDRFIAMNIRQIGDEYGE